MMERNVRIGFVGVGSMGQCAHLRNYVTVPGCQVVAIAELREKTARRVAKRYGIPKVYRTHEEMLTDERLDGVVASQPFTRHGVILPELLRTGLPTFSEKPLAASVEAGERIVRAAREGRTWHMVGYHKRSDPATAWARAEVERLKASGEVGRLTYVRITMPAGDWIAGGFTDLIREDDPKPQLKYDPPPTDTDEATHRDYVSFVNYYIHQVNLMRHLLGEPYSVTFADPKGVVLAGQSQSGVPCVLEMSPYRTTVDWQESALIAFERGYVRLDLPAPLASNRPGKAEVLRDPGNGAAPETVRPHLPWVHAMRQQAMNFVRAIRGEAPPPCDSEEALEDLKVAREYMRLLKSSQGEGHG
ncbi:MAG: dehydrogenase [Candidatus Handelsmanbacteria bacterium RIFCSPLOWO2_12_FULL_64_10]|uniref:Dehydrogenase n=1 Tax=Handelsmanbacteria sp. (strain RIFCSPLOWO2_12_FULL_64_10) TaxID=1817868 RepID=A0A1F6CD59_HANXR|nr:MAG: dehydrogenase [Candidatus Handelsmanbacteria bacterium RIFCSPLOWO2_12_FULL_64_10]